MTVAGMDCAGCVGKVEKVSARTARCPGIECFARYRQGDRSDRPWDHRRGYPAEDRRDLDERDDKLVLAITLRSPYAMPPTCCASGSGRKPPRPRHHPAAVCRVPAWRRSACQETAGAVAVAVNASRAALACGMCCVLPFACR